MSHDPKSVVARFNQECIAEGRPEAYRALLAPSFRNHSAPPGASAGPEAMQAFFEQVLRPALGPLRVEIHDQLVDGDKVITRKTLRGRHVGPLFGIPASGREVGIQVIDIVRVEGGRYVEHWGQNDLATVLATLG